MSEPSVLEHESMRRAFALLRKEHEEITSVVESMQRHARETASGLVSPDFALLASMLHFLEEYPEAVHHPLEDALIFSVLKSRGGPVHPLVAELEAEHQHHGAALLQLQRALVRYLAGVKGSAEEFAQRVDEYAAQQAAHMQKEEDFIIELAGPILNYEDWEAVALGFGRQVNPLLGGEPSGRFEQLRSHLGLLTPSKITYGTGNQ
jgi:branched-chain amino acid transport system ATP-binding protein